MTRVKICGITNLEDALAAVAAGADALGLVFAESKRRIAPYAARDIVTALPPFVTSVGVFMNQPLEEVRAIMHVARFDVAQLHGDETPQYCEELGVRVIKRFDVRPDDTPQRLRTRMAPYSVAGYLLDPGAGSGRTFDWAVARGIERPLIVSGGLKPGNVGEVVRLLRPRAVDVASGVERATGTKDHRKIVDFIRSVRKQDVPDTAG